MLAKLIAVHHDYSDLVTACYHTTEQPFTDAVHVATKTLEGDQWVEQYFKQLKIGGPYEPATRVSRFARAILAIDPIVRVDFNQIRKHEFEVVVGKVPGSNWADIDPAVVATIRRVLKWKKNDRNVRVMRYDEFAESPVRNDLGKLETLRDYGTVGGPHRLRRISYKSGK